jgi:hypothetical protein
MRKAHLLIEYNYVSYPRRSERPEKWDIFLDGAIELIGRVKLIVTLGRGMVVLKYLNL